MDAEVPKGNTDAAIRGATARVTSILAIPYGYTVTLWSAGALAFSRLGPPAVIDVFLFALGACAAFVMLAALGASQLDLEVPMRVPALVVFNGFPILAALVVAALPLGALGRPLGYFAPSFLATAAYVLSLSIAVRVGRGRLRPDLR
jgi:hypothetical protein